jgi:hypothetical protein
LFGFEQIPVVELQVPATWHWSGGSQVFAVPEHEPAVQVSFAVHALPSLHAVPSVLLGFEQLPVVVSQTPATWHWSLAEHVFVVPPEHEPVWQVSPVVHALPSLHVVPSVLFGFEHWPVPELQVPAEWHWSLAVHTTGLLPLQAPAWQVSVCVHPSPSLHAVPSVFELHPVVLEVGVHC